MREWARPEEVEVFATGDTLLLTPADPHDADGPSAVHDLVRRGGDLLRGYHAAPGFRPGQRIATTSGRRSGPNDVVRPVLVDPRRACAVAISGALFADPVPGLEIDTTGDDGSDGDYLVWHARLTGERVAATPVSLHLLASPSMVVTVLELVPRRRLRWNRAGVVAAGVAALEIVAHRLVGGDGDPPRSAT